MSKNIFSSAATFAKNVGLHTRLLVSREETPGEAWAEITKDAQKLKRVIAKAGTTVTESEADQLVDEGRRAYNVKDYEKAERFFRQAIVTDSNHCMAHTYLGYALYKMGRLGEAEGSWNRAIDVAPTLKAGDKARQKLLHLQKKKKQAVDDLEERLRGQK
ncbi:MAG: tetratricopeptide repeat protein [FCB group bacterium]|nr:tetratricopeptide repeat protein [FCB group bacterium]